MNLIGASKIITCNKNFDILSDAGILFDKKKILKIGSFKDLSRDYKIDGKFYDSCVITPALTNPHIHFEFSANNTSLEYGSFERWLDSMMDKREYLMKNMESNIKTAIKETLLSGVGCVGAISSNGLDLDYLVNSPLKVMFFNEIIGIDDSKINIIKEDFNTRLENSLKFVNNNFKVGIALHSPYSLHYDLSTYAINIALKNKLLVSTHFLESKEELMWLESGEGYFKNFLNSLLNVKTAKPSHTKYTFLDLFKKVEALFVHCLYLNNDDFEYMSKLNIDIISSPRSNRLLNNRYFDYLKAKDYGFELIISTDGKSSNNSVNMLDEARVALFSYNKFNIDQLAKEIMLSMTSRISKRFGFNNGVIKKNKASDFAIFHIKDIETSTQVALQTILHAKSVKDLYINGERIDIENY